MLCSKCGIEFPNDSAFCSKCGTPLQPSATIEPPPSQPAAPTINAQPTKKKPNGCLISFIVVAGVFGIIGTIGNISNSIEANNLKKETIKYFNENSAKVFAEIEQNIEKGNYQEAMDICAKYSQYVQDKTLPELNKKAQIEQVQAELKDIPSTDYAKRIELFKKLTGLDPENTKYSEQLQYYTQQQERTALIQKQFSAWDGSHIALTRMIKDSMNDPKSYEHVKTVYWESKDYLTVLTTFRGRNAFGGLVLDSVKAKFSIDGILLEVIED